MGVTESRAGRRLKDEKRLEDITRRQLEIEWALSLSTERLVPLLAEYDNLSIERGILERKLGTT